ncbi:hypothetical protein MHYP_G00070170 [Metynnis hypsauchen]
MTNDEGVSSLRLVHRCSQLHYLKMSITAEPVLSSSAVVNDENYYQPQAELLPDAVRKSPGLEKHPHRRPPAGLDVNRPAAPTSNDPKCFEPLLRFPAR